MFPDDECTGAGLVFSNRRDNVVGEMQCASNLFRRSTAEIFVQRLLDLSKEFVENPRARALAELTLQSGESYDDLARHDVWNPWTPT